MIKSPTLQKTGAKPLYWRDSGTDNQSVPFFVQQTDMLQDVLDYRTRHTGQQYVSEAEEINKLRAQVHTPSNSMEYIQQSAQTLLTALQGLFGTAGGDPDGRELFNAPDFPLWNVCVRYDSAPAIHAQDFTHGIESSRDIRLWVRNPDDTIGWEQHPVAFIGNSNFIDLAAHQGKRVVLLRQTPREMPPARTFGETDWAYTNRLFDRIHRLTMEVGYLTTIRDTGLKILQKEKDPIKVVTETKIEVREVIKEVIKEVEKIVYQDAPSTWDTSLWWERSVVAFIPEDPKTGPLYSRYPSYASAAVDQFPYWERSYATAFETDPGSLASIQGGVGRVARAKYFYADHVASNFVGLETSGYNLYPARFPQGIPSGQAVVRPTAVLDNGTYGRWLRYTVTDIRTPTLFFVLDDARSTGFFVRPYQDNQLPADYLPTSGNFYLFIYNDDIVPLRNRSSQGATSWKDDPRVPHWGPMPRDKKFYPRGWAVASTAASEAACSIYTKPLTDQVSQLQRELQTVRDQLVAMQQGGDTTAAYLNLKKMYDDLDSLYKAQALSHRTQIREVEEQRDNFERLYREEEANARKEYQARLDAADAAVKAAEADKQQAVQAAQDARNAAEAQVRQLQAQVLVLEAEVEALKKDLEEARNNTGGGGGGTLQATIGDMMINTLGNAVALVRTSEGFRWAEEDSASGYALTTEWHYGDSPCKGRYLPYFDRQGSTIQEFLQEGTILTNQPVTAIDFGAKDSLEFHIGTTEELYHKVESGSVSLKTLSIT